MVFKDAQLLLDLQNYLQVGLMSFSLFYKSTSNYFLSEIWLRVLLS